MPEADKTQGWWVRWRIIAITAAALTAVAYVAQVEVGRNLPLWAHLVITVFGAASAGVSLFLPFREERRQERLVEKAKDLATKEATVVRSGLQDRLLLIANCLVEIANLNGIERTAEEKRIKQLIVDLLGGKLGIENARASFFTYYDQPKRRLVCEGNMWHGRGQGPRTIFEEGTTRGVYMLDMIDAKGSKFESDVTKNKPDGWDDKGWAGERDYQTFIAVTVAARDKVFGMLTLDAPRAGDLRDVDYRAVRLFAQLLAAGLAM